MWSRAFIDLVVVQALFGFAYSIFVLLPKILAVTYGAGAHAIGLVMAAFGLLSLAATPAIGPIISRAGRPRAMLFSCLLLAGSALAMVGIQSAGLAAALLRGLQGVAWSVFFAAGMSMVVDVAPAARLGHAIGLFGAANLAMTAVAPPIAEPIAAHYGPRPVFVLACAVAVIAAWYCRRLFAGDRPARASSLPPAQPRSPVARTRAAIILVLTVGALAAAMMFTFVAPFALQQGIGVVRGFFIAYTVTALGVRIAGARLADRAGHRRMALLGGTAYGAVVAAMGLFGPGHLVVLGLLFGIAHGAVFPSLMALLLGSSTAIERPRLLALTNGAINLGVLGLAGLGPLAERIGYPAVFVGVGALTFTTALLLSRDPGRVPNPPR